jgi:hypothetical protein
VSFPDLTTVTLIGVLIAAAAAVLKMILGDRKKTLSKPPTIPEKPIVSAPEAHEKTHEQIVKETADLISKTLDALSKKTAKEIESEFHKTFGGKT